MELTPRASALRGPLGEALQRLDALLIAEAFNPSSSHRHFRLMMPDLVVDLLLPRLLQGLSSAAPNVTLEVTPWRGPGSVGAEFAHSVDLVVTVQREQFPGFYRQRIYRDRDALCVRSDHPLAARLRRRDVFLAARHVAVVGAGEREDLIEPWLREQTLLRRVVLTVPNYLSALHVVSRSDLVAFVPSRLIATLAPSLRLRKVMPPVDPGVDEQFMFHPARAHKDGASRWLRQQLVAVAGELARA